MHWLGRLDQHLGLQGQVCAPGLLFSFYFFAWLTCRLTFLENKSDNPSFVAINYVLSKRLHFDHQSVDQKLRWVF